MEVKRFVLAACVLALLTGGAPRHEAHLLPRFTSVVPLPPGYPPPPAPDSNPLTEAKIELGRRLFYDKRLSANGTQSCGSCHQQRFAFCDGRAHAIGSTGQEHSLNTMSLLNVAYRTPLTWSDRSVTTLEQQALIPLTNEHPVEMGMAGRLDELPARVADYAPMFEAAFPGEQISVQNIVRAIASFERSIVSADSPYDQLAHRGDTQALSPEAWRGAKLFFARCSGCHGGLDFASGPATTKFRIPTLRNVALTAPYLHDGSITTLMDVVDAYADGRRAPDVQAFAASAEERHALVAFLESVTDESVTTNPRFSDPAAQRWTIDRAHSDVSFRIRHLLSNVRGRFGRFSGTITRTSVELTIDAASIDTNEEERDDDLRSANFFDVAKYPRLSFKSAAIRQMDAHRYEVTGDLTMHGITKRVTLPVKYLGEAKDPYSGRKVSFETTFTIRRSEYGITWNHPLDDGGVLLGDEVTVEITIEALVTQ